MVFLCLELSERLWNCHLPGIVHPLSYWNFVRFAYFVGILAIIDWNWSHWYHFGPILMLLFRGRSVIIYDRYFCEERTLELIEVRLLTREVMIPV